MNGSFLRRQNRLWKILKVFAKHNLGYLKDKVETFFYHTRDHGSFPCRMRLAFEELGPTFIKFGQLISMNPAVFSVKIVEEFGRCRDQVPPFSFDIVKEIVEQELEGPIKDKFLHFDSKPVSAASIAQVHGAALKDGSKVVLKIQRPGIRETIETDIDIMNKLARLVSGMMPRLRPANPSGIVKNFDITTHEELDFIKEADSLEKFSKIFEEDEEVVIPKVYREFTTKKVLTMERLYGIKINETEKLKARGVDLGRLVKVGMKVLIKSAFGSGFFHGDIHAGNVIVLAGEKYGLIDFGIMGSLDEAMRKKVAKMLYFSYMGDFRNSGLIIKELASANGLHLEKFLSECEKVGNRYLAKTLQGGNWIKFLKETLDAARRYHIQLPVPLILIIKQVLYLDGIGRIMDPGYDMLKDGSSFTGYFINYM